MVVKNKLPILLPIILSLLNTIVIGVLLWSSNRCFDLSDESYYFLGYLFAGNNPDLYPASFHLVYNRFFSEFHFNLIEVRVLRIILTIISSVLLYFGAKSIFLYQKTTEKLTLFNIILSGMLLSYAWAPLTLSYNTMSSILITLIIGLWLLLITQKQAFIKAFFVFTLGGLFSILFFVKITNLLLLPMLIVITGYLIFKKKLSKHIRPKFTLYYLLTFILGTYASLAFLSNDISLITIQQTIYDYLQESFGVLANDSTHTTSYLLNRYYKNALMVFTELKYPLAFFTLLYFSLQFFWTKIKLDKFISASTIFKIIGITVITVLIFQNDFWKGGTKVKYSMLFIYILLLTITLFNGFLEKKSRDLILLLATFAIPISGAAGTNNGLSAQVLFYGVFIFLAIYYIVSLSKNYYYKSAIFIILIGIASSQIICATLYYPYQQTPLSESTHQLKNVAGLGPLKVDASLFQLDEELAFLERLEANYIFSYSPQRGAALFAHKKPYSLEWFHASHLEKICDIIDKSEIDPEDIIFLLPSHEPLKEEVLECLNNKGILFKLDFVQAKSVTYYDQYYKKEIQLNIYIPNFEKK